MVVAFSSIRPHLRQSVLEKIVFTDFSRFSQCSKYSETISKSLKQSLPWKVYEIYSTSENEITISIDREKVEVSWFLDQFPIRIEVQQIYFQKMSTEACKEIIKLLELGKIRPDEIIFGDILEEVPPELFNRLLKVSQIKSLYSAPDAVHIDYLHQPEVAKIPEISFRMYTTPRFSLDWFLTCTSSKIRFWPVELNVNVLNRILKQWFDGSRNIREIHFTFEPETLELDQDERIFSEIPYEFIWSIEKHAESRFSYLDVDEISSDDNCRWYALKRGDEELLAILGGTTFFVEKVFNALDSFKRRCFFHGIV